MEITIGIPGALAARARSHGLSAERYVKQLLDRIAAEPDELERSHERLRSEFAADWEHYASTGLHVDGDELEAWLGMLEKGHDAEPPAVHDKSARESLWTTDAPFQYSGLHIGKFRSTHACTR